MAVDITLEEMNSITAAIYKRHGIDFTCYEPKSLKRRFVRAFSVFNLGSVHELWKLVLEDPEFIHPFINELTVGLTSMFRDPRLWLYMRQVVAEILQKKDKIRVWHAGCSTGEEVYTFNIVLSEMGVLDQVESWATDINRDALLTAESGEYHYLRMMDYESNYAKYNPQGDLTPYYKKEQKIVELDKSLVRNVRFVENNLLSERLLHKFDIIFCRNVMIYFDNQAKKKVLDKFYSNLQENGLLVIGYFDSLVPVIDRTKFDFYNLDYKIFKKIDQQQSAYEPAERKIAL